MTFVLRIVPEDVSSWHIADISARSSNVCCLGNSVRRRVSLVHLCALSVSNFRNLIGFSSLKANVNRSFQRTEIWMSDVLALAKPRLTIGLDRRPPSVEPLIADQWVN